MDKRTKTLILFDIYGDLLTEKQKTIMDYYYNDDLSLSEIGENGKISRQAIHDTIKKCEKLLYGYEEKLQLLKKNTILKETKEEIEDILLRLDAESSEHVKDIVKSLRQKLKEIN